MNIIHIADESWDSGLTEYALLLAQTQRAGHKILFIARENGHAAKECAARGLAVLETAKGCGGILKILPRAAKFKPDIINAHTGSAHSCGLLLKLMLLGRPALVRTRADARRLKAKPLAALQWRFTDGFIAANSAILADFAMLRFKKPDARMILQGINANPSSEPMPKTPVIGMAGRLDPVKDHRTAIAALSLVKKSLPDAVLRIAGAEKNIKAAQLADYAESLGIKDSVKLEGFVPDMEAFMRQCSVGLIASCGSEAVSRAAIEWLAQSRPVAATNVGGIPDLIEDGKTGFIVPPQKPEEMAKALLAMLSNPSKLSKMSEAAARAYKECFTARKFAEDTCAFYAEITNARKK